MRKDPIHLLYKELFQIGKRFDQNPILKLYAKESSKKLNRIRSLNEPFTPLLYQRFISEKSNNWTHSSEDFELFRELSYTLKYAEDKVKWFNEVPSHPLPQPSVDILDFNNIKEGNILVAHPSLENTNYQQAVVLLLAVSPQEIVGITINKPSHKNVYDGGPVKNYTAYDTKLIALFSKENLFRDGMKIAPNLYYVICKRKELEGINPSDYVLFFGTMRWGRAQLKNEIENDNWVLLDCPIENIYKPVAKTYTETWQKDENGNDFLMVENLCPVGQDLYDSEISRQQELFKKYLNSDNTNSEKDTNSNSVEIKIKSTEEEDADKEAESDNNKELKMEKEKNEDNKNNKDEEEREKNLMPDISKEERESQEKLEEEKKWPSQEKNEKIHDYINRILLIENANLGSKIKQLKMHHSKLKMERLRDIFHEKEERERAEAERELKLVGWSHPKVLWNHLLTLIGGEISLGIYCFEKPKIKKENPKIESLTNQLEIIQKGLENLNEESKKLCEESSEISLSLGKLSVKKDKLKEESEKLSHAQSQILASLDKEPTNFDNKNNE